MHHASETQPWKGEKENHIFLTWFCQFHLGQVQQKHFFFSKKAEILLTWKKKIDKI